MPVAMRDRWLIDASIVCTDVLGDETRASPARFSQLEASFLYTLGGGDACRTCWPSQARGRSSVLLDDRPFAMLFCFCTWRRNNGYSMTSVPFCGFCAPRAVRTKRRTSPCKARSWRDDEDRDRMIGPGHAGSVIVR